MYRHPCGARAETIGGAFAHLLDCPLEEDEPRVRSARAGRRERRRLMSGRERTVEELLVDVSASIKLVERR